MSLVGFKAQNHPQQPRRDDIDDRWTPLNLWIPWNQRWQFTLDAAASDKNHLCDRYFTVDQDGLAQSWKGERVWCNPPYSDLRAWADKAWREMINGCQLVVMLAPANRSEQRWWQELIEPHRDGRDTSRVAVTVGSGLAGRIHLSTEFLPRRINFGSLNNLGAWSASSAPFGCVLLAWEREE